MTLLTFLSHLLFFFEMQISLQRMLVTVDTGSSDDDHEVNEIPSQDYVLFLCTKT